jgi:hypothetical protein
MKIIFNIFISLLLIAFVSNGVKAQQSLPESVEQKLDSNNYKSWRKVELPEFSIYVPKEFKLEKLSGIDTTGWSYKDKDVNFLIYSGSSVLDGPLKTQQKLQGYKEKIVFIGEIFIRMWFYKDDSEESPFVDYPYMGVASFKNPIIKGSKYVIILMSKDSEGQELAEKIFLSLKFNK